MNGAPKEEKIKEKIPALQVANRMMPCFRNGISSNINAVLPCHDLSASQFRVYAKRVGGMYFHVMLNVL